MHGLILKTQLRMLDTFPEGVSAQFDLIDIKIVITRTKIRTDVLHPKFGPKSPDCWIPPRLPWRDPRAAVQRSEDGALYYLFCTICTVPPEEILAGNNKPSKP